MLYRTGNLRCCGRYIGILRSMQQRMVHEDEGQHGFGDWCRTNADARIVTAVGFNHDRFALLIDRFARDSNTRCGLDANRDNDILTG